MTRCHAGGSAYHDLRVSLGYAVTRVLRVRREDAAFLGGPVPLGVRGGVLYGVSVCLVGEGTLADFNPPVRPGVSCPPGATRGAGMRQGADPELDRV